MLLAASGSSLSSLPRPVLAGKEDRLECMGNMTEFPEDGISNDLS